MKLELTDYAYHVMRGIIPRNTTILIVHNIDKPFIIPQRVLELRLYGAEYECDIPANVKKIYLRDTKLKQLICCAEELHLESKYENLIIPESVKILYSNSAVEYPGFHPRDINNGVFSYVKIP